MKAILSRKNNQAITWRFSAQPYNNSSIYRRQYAEKISRLGLSIPEELVLTSGEATALHLKRQHSGAKLFVVGTPSLEDEFRQYGFQLFRLAEVVEQTGLQRGRN